MPWRLGQKGALGDTGLEDRKQVEQGGEAYTKNAPSRT